MTSPEAVTLLPCPFCGGEASINQIGINKVEIKCSKCFIKRTQRCLRYSVEWLTNSMIAKWNTRAAPRPTDAEMALDNLETLLMYAKMAAGAKDGNRGDRKFDAYAETIRALLQEEK